MAIVTVLYCFSCNSQFPIPAITFQFIEPPQFFKKEIMNKPVILGFYGKIIACQNEVTSSLAGYTELISYPV